MAEIVEVNIAADEIQAATPEAQKACGPAGRRKTICLILGNEMVEKGTTAGVQAQLTFYLKRQYFISNAAVAAMLVLWNALSNFTSPFASVAADLYGRFRVIAVSSALTFLGMGILWATTFSSEARPPPCDEAGQPCEGPTAGQLLLVLTSFFLMAIGGGGTRRCSQAFAADIGRTIREPTISRWYQTGVGIWLIISVLLLIVAQEECGWVFGFGSATTLVLLSLLVFLVDSIRYISMSVSTDSDDGGGLTVMKSLSRVISATWWKRRHSMRDSRTNCWLYESRSSTLVCPTNRFSFLNKACLIVNAEEEINPTTGLPTDPWALCSVQQVEEVKALLQLLPVWSTGVIAAAATIPPPFASLQAELMKRQFIGRRIRIPESAYGIFAVASSTLCTAFYNLLIPNAAGRDIPATWRMGIGMGLSCMANVVAGAVERSRRGGEIFAMPANWLIPQFCLVGLGEGFSAAAQIEFYDSQLDGIMKGTGKGLWSMGQFVGGLIAGLVLLVTGDGGSNWLADDLDGGHYDFYYWLLATLGLMNLLFYYLMICRWPACRERFRFRS